MDIIKYKDVELFTEEAKILYELEKRFGQSFSVVDAFDYNVWMRKTGSLFRVDKNYIIGIEIEGPFEDKFPDKMPPSVKNDESYFYDLVQIHEQKFRPKRKKDIEGIPDGIELEKLKDLSIGELLSSLSNLEELSLISSPVSLIQEIFQQKLSIKKLTISYANIASILESIENLTQIQELRMQGNDLIYLPDTIGNLSSLRILSITHNKLLTLPKSIGNLKLLEELDLEQNKIESLPDSIGSLIYLKILNLEENQLKELPNSIGDLKALKTLSLIRNDLSKLPDSIGNLSSLESFHINGNRIAYFPSTIKNLKSLKDVRIWGNNISEDLIKNISEKTEEFGREYHVVNPMKFIDYPWESLKEESQYVKVHGKKILVKDVLNLRNLGITSFDEIEGLQSLKNLKKLDLFSNQISEIKNLETLENLEELDISFNQISEITGLDKISNLKVLNLSSNKIREIKNLEKLTDLEDLDFCFNQIKEIKGLDNLTNLKVLFLAQNRYRKIKGLEHLVNLKHLTLDLLNDMKLEGLQNLNNLEQLGFHFSAHFHDFFNELGGIDYERGHVFKPHRIVEYCKINQKSLDVKELEKELKNEEKNKTTFIILEELANKGNIEAKRLYLRELARKISIGDPIIVSVYSEDNEIKSIYKSEIANLMNQEKFFEFLNRICEEIHFTFENMLEFTSNDTKIKKSRFKWIDGISLKNIFSAYCFFHKDLMDDWEFPRYSYNQKSFYKFLWKTIREKIDFNETKINMTFVGDLFKIIKIPLKYCDGGYYYLYTQGEYVIEEEEYYYLFKECGFIEEIIAPLTKRILNNPELKEVFINQFNEFIEANERYIVFRLFYVLLENITQDDLTQIFEKSNLNIIDIILEEGALSEPIYSLLDSVGDSISPLVKQYIVNVINDHNYEKLFAMIKNYLLGHLNKKNFLFLITNEQANLFDELIKGIKDLKKESEIFEVPIIPEYIINNSTELIIQKIKKVLQAGDQETCVALIRLGMINHLKEKELKVLFKDFGKEILLSIIKTIDQYYDIDWIFSFLEEFNEIISKSLYHLIIQLIQKNDAENFSALSKWMIGYLNIEDLKSLITDPEINLIGRIIKEEYFAFSNLLDSLEESNFIDLIDVIFNSIFKAISNDFEADWIWDREEALFKSFPFKFHHILIKKICEIIHRGKFIDIKVLKLAGLLEILDEEDIILILDNPELLFLENIIKALGNDEFYEWICEGGWWGYNFFKKLHKADSVSLNLKIIEIIKNCTAYDLFTILTSEPIDFIKREDLISLIENSNIDLIEKFIETLKVAEEKVPDHYDDIIWYINWLHKLFVPFKSNIKIKNKVMKILERDNIKDFIAITRLRWFEYFNFEDLNYLINDSKVKLLEKIRNNIEKLNTNDLVGILFNIYTYFTDENFFQFFNSLPMDFRYSFPKSLIELIYRSRNRELKNYAFSLLRILGNSQDLEKLDYITLEGEIFLIRDNTLNIRDRKLIDIMRLRGLNHLTNLKKLSLRSNMILEINGLDSLESLEILDLGWNHILEINGLNSLKLLKTLDLSFNQISEIKGLESLINLKSLNLDRNRLTEIKGLESLISLQYLKIYHSGMSGELIQKLGGIDLGNAKDPQKFVEYCRKMKENEKKE